MTENICNEDMQLSFSNVSGPGDLVYTGDAGIDPTMVVPTLSPMCKALNKKIATTAITITWPAGTCPFTSASSAHVIGAGSVAATATKCRASLQLVLREGDVGSCAGSWQPTGGPPPPPIPCSCNVSVSSAGQQKVKGN